MDTNENISTQSDDNVNVDNGQTEQALLDAVMKNSPIMDEISDPLPVEEVPEVDPADTAEEDPESVEEVVSEEAEEEVEAAGEEVTEDDAPEGATNESDIFTADDLDLDAKVAVKIDGADTEVSFGDLIKGYSTEQSLSKKGRELGEARKALETEREEKIGELDNIATASSAIMLQGEQGLAKQYGELEAQIEKARKDGDTYELSDLKDKREQVQKDYWKARKQREGLQQAVAKQKEEVQTKQWQEQLDHFHKEIPNMIPDFNDKVANDIRDFAVAEGIKPEILDQITDPAIVKFVDDYRRLKSGVKKGVAKRKVAPVRKGIPIKKSKPIDKRKADAAQMVKARAFKDDASQADQNAFLLQMASKSLNKL